jgi:hypothetical protein
VVRGRIVAVLASVLLLGLPSVSRASGPAPGDVVTDFGGLAVVVPPPGLGTNLVVDLADGTSQELSVTTLADGTVVVDGLGDDSPGEGAVASPAAPGVSPAPAECTDRAHSFLPGRWTGQMAWWYSARTTPARMSAAAVATEMLQATRNIANGRNVCGRADNVSASTQYRGTIARNAQIVGLLCMVGDGFSVASFGPMPVPALAGNCNRTRGGAIVESDTLFNNLYPWYTARPAGCSGRFGIEAVMTHERGHAFGLDHVSEDKHGYLTMSTATAACDDSPSTLGLGDLLGLEAKY